MIHEALHAAGRCNQAGTSAIGYLEALARQHDHNSQEYSGRAIRRCIEMIRIAEKDYLEVVKKQKKDEK